MKIPWKSLGQLVAAIYKAFLKGKTVNVPGVGPVTLPSQGPTVNDRGMGAPHDPAFPQIRTLVGASAAKEAEGKATPVYGPTAGLILFIVFGLPTIALVLVGAWEAKTLASPLKGDHITAQLRALFFRAPGAVTLALVVWWGFLSAIAFGVAAHAWF